MRTLALFFLSCGLPFSTPRSWEDIIPYHDMNPVDPNVANELREISSEVLFLGQPSPSPTVSPTKRPRTPRPTRKPTRRPRPTRKPTRVPSPTRKPTRNPTPSPTRRPTRRPTRKPTAAPTRKPTSSPTPMPTSYSSFAPNPAPTSPRAGFFNYDIRKSALYGPGYPQRVAVNATHFQRKYKNNGWASKYQTPSDFYWDEFDQHGFGPWKGALARRNPSLNRCNRVGRQSPIDIRPNGAICYEHHQIRNYPGDFAVHESEVDKQIHPNKLRLQWTRRPCADHNHKACSEPDPPHADFSHNFGGFADLMHIDFKVPSEHTIGGERFDGEMQMFHLHRSRARMPTTSVLMRVTKNGFNAKLQQALNEFQKLYNSHAATCAKKKRQQRELVTEVHKVLGEEVQSPYHDYLTWGDYSTHEDDPDAEADGELKESTERRLQRWDPYDLSLVPTVHFYSYDGSLTEPPCGEWVSWRIFDKPMKISFSQLEQIKRLIFTHVSPSCERIGAQWAESVARPIQDTFGRDVYYCGQYNFQGECAFFPPACKTK